MSNSSESNMDAASTRNYGGEWTKEKLSILGGYLDNYTTALKNQRFNLMYVDAFAGAGKVNLQGEEIDGSALIALDVKDKTFDKLIFVEKDERQFKSLKELQSQHKDRNIEVQHFDANKYLEKLCNEWSKHYSTNWRGVIFLDPFATQVNWATIESVAKTKVLDTWILFPVSGIARMLPKNREPEQISESWKQRLTRIFGDESWRDLYNRPKQVSLLPDESKYRAPGVDRIIEIYKGKLKYLVGARLLNTAHRFKNSKNSRIFEFIFFAGDDGDRAINLSHKITTHLMKN